jgi:hypothetical protein
MAIAVLISDLRGIAGFGNERGEDPRGEACILDRFEDPTAGGFAAPSTQPCEVLDAVGTRLPDQEAAVQAKVCAHRTASRRCASRYNAPTTFHPISGAGASLMNNCSGASREAYPPREVELTGQRTATQTGGTALLRVPNHRRAERDGGSNFQGRRQAGKSSSRRSGSAQERIPPVWRTPSATDLRCQ